MNANRRFYSTTLNWNGNRDATIHTQHRNHGYSRLKGLRLVTFMLLIKGPNPFDIPMQRHLRALSVEQVVRSYIWTVKTFHTVVLYQRLNKWSKGYTWTVKKLSIAFPDWKDWGLWHMCYWSKVHIFLTSQCSVTWGDCWLNKWAKVIMTFWLECSWDLDVRHVMHETWSISCSW